MTKYETGPVRGMADVDAELALLQTSVLIDSSHFLHSPSLPSSRRFDSLERVMDDKMRLLFNCAQKIISATPSIKDSTTMDHTPTYLFERAPFPKLK